MIGLMGKRARDVLESSEVVDVFLASHALNRRGRNPFMALRGELTLDEANDLVRRLGLRAKSTPDPSDAEQGRRSPIAIIEHAIARLSAKAEEHEQLAAGDEARMAAEREFDTSPVGLDLARYESRCKKLMKRSAVTLRKQPGCGAGETRRAAASVRQPAPANRDGAVLRPLVERV